MLITFEGIDGSGKSTQIALLRDKLTDKGFKVSVFREPGGTDISEMIRGMLLKPELEIDPITELLLFSSARSQLIAEKVKPHLAEGKVVILDRFYDSTTAYQGYGRKSLPLDEIHQLNKIASHSLAPDITFYLRLSLEESALRTAQFEKDRMEQSGDSFFKKVYNGFEELMKTESRFKAIDANQSPEEVHTDIYTVLEERLSI